MAQVSVSDVVKSFYNCKVEYSLNGTDWTDMSGYANSVGMSGQERTSGEAYTFDGEFALIGYGKMSPVETTMSILYTENAAHPFQVIYDAKMSGTAIYLRWAPRGGAAGDWMWTTGEGLITVCPPPAGEASAGDPIAVEFTHRCSNITKSNVAS